MVVLRTAAKNTHCPHAQSLRRGHWLQTIGSMYENDLTHSNAANARGSRSLHAPHGRTVDVTQHPEKPIVPQLVPRSATGVDQNSIPAGKNRNQPRSSGK